MNNPPIDEHCLCERVPRDGIEHGLDWQCAIGGEGSKLRERHFTGLCSGGSQQADSRLALCIRTRWSKDACYEASAMQLLHCSRDVKQSRICWHFATTART